MVNNIYGSVSVNESMFTNNKSAFILYNYLYYYQKYAIFISYIYRNIYMYITFESPYNIFDLAA